MAEKEKKTESEEEKTPEQEIESLTDSLKRLQADFNNYRRRTEEEAKSIKQTANETMLRDLLNINDNLEMAIKHVSKEDKNEFYKGVKLIHDQITSFMVNQGLKRIKHDEFDANLHEALLTEDSDKPKNEITEVIHQGYTLAGKVLRPSKVKLSNGGK